MGHVQRCARCCPECGTSKSCCLRARSAPPRSGLGWRLGRAFAAHRGHCARTLPPTQSDVRVSLHTPFVRSVAHVCRHGTGCCERRAWLQGPPRAHRTLPAHMANIHRCCWTPSARACALSLSPALQARGVEDAGRGDPQEGAHVHLAPSSLVAATHSRARHRYVTPFGVGLRLSPYRRLSRRPS